MEVLAVIGVIGALVVFSWLWTKVTAGVESKAIDLTESAFFSAQREQAANLGSHVLRIRTQIPPARVWKEIEFQLPVPASRPRTGDQLYIAGPLPTTLPTSYGMHVDWNDDIQSLLVVFLDEDGTCVCEHAMFRWCESGIMMRKAAPRFMRLREQLVNIIRNLDPAAQAILVDENDYERPFTPDPSSLR